MSPTQGAALVADWRQSGLGPVEYCRQHAVGLHRLSYWRNKQAPNEFVEVVVDRDNDHSRDTEDALSIEVVVGDVFVRFPDRAGAAEEILSALARGVR